MTPIIPFRPSADDLIIQLGIAVHNLGNVPLSEIADATVIDEGNEAMMGIMALQKIAMEISQICLAAATYNLERSLKCKQ